MKPFHIALIEPQIPPNTGNIARTCAATGTALHLVKPLGFDVSDRALKRAGLDYWPLVNLKIHENLESFMREYEGNPMYFVTTKGRRVYCETDFEEGAMFLFGKETAGLGEALLRENAEHTIRIPMLPDERLRSLNLANSAAIVLYDALRRRGFPGFA